ncbi:MAG: pyrroline-5-carboxylate reductase [Putridiphycobacter sp.]
MKNSKITIIGGGNLGLSMANGLMNNPEIQNQNITVTKRQIETLNYLTEKGVKVTGNNAEAIRQADLVIVALKPYNILDVLTELKGAFKPGQILVSVATGISIDQIENVVGNAVKIYRAMPNTASGVSMSATCIASKTNEQHDLVKGCFESFGSAIFIDENLMESATVLGACGVAYVLRFIRGMIQGGIQIGFDSKTATEIATQTVKGAAELLIQGDTHPEQEIDKVTTPKGCTIAGLNEMEHNGFSSALIKGILTSYEAI